MLKGGTLLAHVYKSPRQVVRDADYTYVDPASQPWMTLWTCFASRGQTGSTSTRQKLNGRPAPTCTKPREWHSASRTSLSGGGVAVALDISMSVRSGECLDGPVALMYTDATLAGESRFEVKGLSLPELGAEKGPRSATKQQARHYIDLAYIGRDYELDAEKRPTSFRGNSHGKHVVAATRTFAASAHWHASSPCHDTCTASKLRGTRALEPKSFFCPKSKTGPTIHSRNSKTCALHRASLETHTRESNTPLEQQRMSWSPPLHRTPTAEVAIYTSQRRPEHAIAGDLAVTASMAIRLVWAAQTWMFPERSGFRRSGVFFYGS